MLFPRIKLSFQAIIKASVVLGFRYFLRPYVSSKRFKESKID